MLLPGRLAHLFTISRPVPLRHCTCAQSLPRDGPPHSKQDVRTDPKIEITFSGLPVELVSIPGHSNSGSISQIKAMISSFLLSQGGCAHLWFLWDGCTHAKDGYTPTSQHWDFNVLSTTCRYLFPPQRMKISNGGSQHTMF